MTDMSDIVERLEQFDTVACAEQPYAAWFLMEQAADEITRLRAALAAEREECAKVAEARTHDAEYGTWQAQEGLIIAADIRSRETTVKAE